MNEIGDDNEENAKLTQVNRKERSSVIFVDDVA